MHTMLLRTICLTAVMILAACSQSVLAAGEKIEFDNNLDIGIKGVFCVDSEASSKQFIQEVAKESSVTIDAKNVPDDVDCTRVYVLLDNGAGWQFYPEPALGAATKISLNLDRPDAYSKERYPSLFVKLSDDVYVSPAGAPLAAVAQTLLFGMEEADWTRLGAPDSHGDYVVSFATVSWSLTEEGITYYDEPIGNNLRIASRIELTAPFAMSMLVPALEGFKELGCRPWMVSLGSDASTFGEEGIGFHPEATPIDGLDSDDARWQALNDILSGISNGNGSLNMVFGNEEIRFEFEWDLDTGKAILRLVRGEDAAFG